MSRTSLLKSARAEVARKNPLRRAVRIEARNGDQIIGKTKSFTAQSGLEYHPSIDCETFEFVCDCRDHECRRRVCKHLKSLALSLIRRGDLPAVFFERAGLNCCHECGGVQALYPMCHADGSPMQGVSICRACIAKMNTKTATPQEIAANTEEEPWEMPEEPLVYVDAPLADHAPRQVAQVEAFRSAFAGCATVYPWGFDEDAGDLQGEAEEPRDFDFYRRGLEL